MSFQRIRQELPRLQSQLAAMTRDSVVRPIALVETGRRDHHVRQRAIPWPIVECILPFLLRVHSLADDPGA